MKVGVLVVAYNAESTLADVLRRTPGRDVLAIHEVLVQDDHSTDATTQTAEHFRAVENDHDLSITVVRHPCNLGYGGNQKVGYDYAIANGWDVVVLLHGDGQYAPEVMPELVAPIVAGDADAVFGSRMMHRGEARAGGMPLYKYVGNRILTTIQNRLTGLGLSEWHSGYRAYRVSALAEIAYGDNSDVFDFDTEIILQLAAANKTIAEVPIPTYYGDEICRVNGMRYALDVVVDTTRYRLGRVGFGDGTYRSPDDTYEFKTSPHSSHGRIARLVGADTDRPVLDVGCGSGELAAVLRASGHTVVGVDQREPDGAAMRMDRFVAADLGDGLPDEVGSGFGTVIAADVIEHLADPTTLMRDLGGATGSDGSVIISVPNFGHWYPRLRVAFGRWDYDERGILDRTHLRFFNRRTFLRAAAEAGLTP
ncbi:MAG: bifunctional glycosyltransferase/class I SAM-dependent methyltransferase, partial [Actinomycetota bacterium]